MVDLQIIIPVYNEGPAIRRVYDHLCKALGAETLIWEVLCVYDFDADTTLPTLQDIAATDPRIRPIKQTYGKGVVNALKFAFAQAHDGAVAVVMGDDSDELENLPVMLQYYQAGALVVAASRYSAGGQYQGGVFIKKCLSRLAGRLLYWTGIGTRDPTNNFKLYSGQFLHSIQIESKAGFEIALELTVKAALQQKGAVREVATTWRDREDGESKFRLFKWLPFYLHWFCFYFFKKLRK